MMYLRGQIAAHQDAGLPNDKRQRRGMAYYMPHYVTANILLLPLLTKLGVWVKFAAQCFVLRISIMESIRVT